MRCIIYRIYRVLFLTTTYILYHIQIGMHVEICSLIIITHSTFMCCVWYARNALIVCRQLDWNFFFFFEGVEMCDKTVLCMRRIYIKELRCAHAMCPSRHVVSDVWIIIWRSGLPNRLEIYFGTYPTDVSHLPSSTSPLSVDEQHNNKCIYSAAV